MLTGYPPSITVLIGLPGSGKNTVASRLIDYHNYQALSFDDPVAKIFGSNISSRFVLIGMENQNQDNWLTAIGGELWRIEGRHSHLEPNELQLAKNELLQFYPDKRVDNSDGLASLWMIVDDCGCLCRFLPFR